MASTMHRSWSGQHHKERNSLLSCCIYSELAVGHRCWWAPTCSQPRRSIWKYQLDCNHGASFCAPLDTCAWDLQRWPWSQRGTSSQRNHLVWYRLEQTHRACPWGAPPHLGRFPLVSWSPWHHSRIMRLCFLEVLPHWCTIPSCLPWSHCQQTLMIQFKHSCKCSKNWKDCSICSSWKSRHWMLQFPHRKLMAQHLDSW